MKKIISVLMIFAITLMAGCSNIETVKSNEIFEEEIESDIEIESQEGKLEEISKLNNLDDITNILLIGQDKRTEDEDMRSDCMVLISINKNDNSIKLISFMRDLYVSIPGYKDNRLNAAYRFGGDELLTETIETNFDVKIDNTIEIDFSGFENIIDAIGGVEIEISEDEMNVMNNYMKELNRLNEMPEDTYKLSKSGKQNLNGVQALAYARIRYVGNGDFERTQRQRTIIIEAAKKIKDLNLSQIWKLYNSLSSNVKTDLTIDKILELALVCLQSDIDKIETYNIPEDTAYTSETIRKMAVLVPDIEKCKEVLNEIGIR